MTLTKLTSVYFGGVADGHRAFRYKPREARGLSAAIPRPWHSVVQFIA
ncbi:MAG: hypothetical protein HYZ44_11480 [Bacteroidetes bacterium]|nr:hypothetical protein [Bacteroidota bacterium]